MQSVVLDDGPADMVMRRHRIVSQPIMAPRVLEHRGERQSICAERVVRSGELGAVMQHNRVVILAHELSETPKESQEGTRAVENKYGLRSRLVLICEHRDVCHMERKDPDECPRDADHGRLSGSRTQGWVRATVPEVGIGDADLNSCPNFCQSSRRRREELAVGNSEVPLSLQCREILVGILQDLAAQLLVYQLAREQEALHRSEMVFDWRCWGSQVAVDHESKLSWQIGKPNVRHVVLLFEVDRSVTVRYVRVCLGVESLFEVRSVRSVRVWSLLEKMLGL